MKKRLYEIEDISKDLEKQSKKLKTSGEYTPEEEECMILVVHCVNFGFLGFLLLKNELKDDSQEVIHHIISFVCGNKEEIMKKRICDFGDIYVSQMSGKIKKQKDEKIPEKYLFHRCKLGKVEEKLREELNEMKSEEDLKFVDGGELECDIVYLLPEQTLEHVHDLYHIQTGIRELPSCSIIVNFIYI